ncbi:MAG: hypothetical protein ACR2PG_24090, partial [Hyphomicrobiaceae bacterium]
MTLGRSAYTIVGVAAAAGLVSSLLICPPTTAWAMADAPPNSNVDCRKRKNKKKPECQKQQEGNLSDE